MTKNVNAIAVLCAVALGLTACSGGGDAPNVDPSLNPVNTDIAADPVVQFVSATYTVDETSSVDITVSVSGLVLGGLTVPLTVTGTATGADYTLSANQVSIGTGRSTATITLTAVNDAEDEPVESVIITMGTPSGGLLGSVTQTTVSIVDDDVTPTPGTILGRVSNAGSGAAVGGVAINGGGLTTASSGTGAYALTPVATSGRLLTTYLLNGYAPQSRTTEAFSNDYAQILVNVPMTAIALIDTFDPAVARTMSVLGSPAQIQVTAGTLRAAGGAAPTGMATADVAPLSPGSNVGVLPGNYLVISGGAPVPFESFGSLYANFVDASANVLDLTAGASVTLHIPASSRTATLPASASLFYFDTAAGVWRADGTATLQGSAPNQYYLATSSHASTSWTVGTIYSTVSVTGCVQSPAGTRIADALVTAEGTTYSGTTAAVTNSNGMFTVLMKSSSSGFLQATKGTGLSNSPPVVTLTANITLPTCLLLTPSTLSVKLTWGGSPLDLDSHTLGANSSDHVYYVNRGSLTAAPFVFLDVDDVDGLGPEVTTLAQLAQNRTYRFYVYNYSDTFTPGQTGSPARVEITNNGLQTIFTPPAGESGATRYWHVFDVVTDDSCVPTIVPAQAFLAAAPLNVNIGNSATYCP